jgi:hypothetical protein
MPEEEMLAMKKKSYESPIVERESDSVDGLVSASRPSPPVVSDERPGPPGISDDRPAPPAVSDERPGPPFISD